MNNQTSVESQLRAGIVFSGVMPNMAVISVWRSKCRHYKTKSIFNGKVKITRIPLELALFFCEHEAMKPILPPSTTPKTALQALYDALKVKINACFKALELIQKLYKNVMERVDKSQLVHNRLSSLLDYKSILVKVKHRIGG